MKSSKNQQQLKGSKKDMEFLNSFNKKVTLDLAEEIEKMRQTHFTKEDFERQVKRVQPNGKHKIRKF